MNPHTPPTPPTPPRSYLDIDGFMSPTELDWLRSQAAKYDSVVEVGVFKGRTTLALATASPGKPRVVWAVDDWATSPSSAPGIRYDMDKVKEEFFKVTLAAEVPRAAIYAIQRPSVVAASYFFGPDVDMVFIDADHSYPAVTADLTAWHRVCRHLLCGHDYTWASVRSAVHDYCGAHHLTPHSPESCPDIWYVEL